MIYKCLIYFFTITIRVFYSVLKLFTGFASAAFIAWKLTVAKAIKTINRLPQKKSTR